LKNVFFVEMFIQCTKNKIINSDFKYIRHIENHLIIAFTNYPHDDSFLVSEKIVTPKDFLGIRASLISHPHFLDLRKYRMVNDSEFARTLMRKKPDDDDDGDEDQ